jgi:hypothetical protein
MIGVAATIAAPTIVKTLLVDYLGEHKNPRGMNLLQVKTLVLCALPN